MKKRYTDRQLLDLIEKNPLATYGMLAAELQVSKMSICLRLRKLGIRKEISKAIHEICKRNAYKYVKYLEKAAEGGSVVAIIKLLEIGDVYIPRSERREKIESEGRISVEVSRLDFRNKIKKLPEFQKVQELGMASMKKLIGGE